MNGLGQIIILLTTGGLAGGLVGGLVGFISGKARGYTEGYKNGVEETTRSMRESIDHMFEQEMERHAEEFHIRLQRVINRAEQAESRADRAEITAGNERDRANEMERKMHLLRERFRIFDELRDDEETISKIMELLCTFDFENIEDNPLIDFVTKDVLEDPRMLPTGHTLSRSTIEAIINTASREDRVENRVPLCPKTRQPIPLEINERNYPKNREIASIIELLERTNLGNAIKPESRRTVKQYLQNRDSIQREQLANSSSSSRNQFFG